MKVIIIGSGIGGLAAGLALKRHGHEPVIYERVTEIRPVGAALSVWSNGIKCLNYLGLGAQVKALGGQMDAMSYREGASGEIMTAFSLLPLMERVGQRPYPVARAELQEMLSDEFGRDDIHLGKELTQVSETEGGVRAVFSDGSSAEGDFLIGADGARSTVRDYVRATPTERSYSGYVNWNGLVSADESIAPLDAWTTYVAQGKRASVMPVGGGRFYFFFDVPIKAGLPNDRAAYKRDLRAHFEGWAAPVQTLIDAIDAEKTNRVEIHDVDPFDEWSRGRVVILGDAAHNTSPDLGQGACMAMEDAVVLAQCFAAHDGPPDMIGKRFAQLRAPRCADLVLKARARGAVTHGADPAVTDAWYAELRTETGETIINGIASNIEGGPFA
ncbi:MAG: FAD-dependent urate hydroxylase HpxO [Pseudomonadota bacterium]